MKSDFGKLVDFKLQIATAARAGLIKGAEAVLQNLSRSAGWYEGKMEQLKKEDFNKMHRSLHEAEALWAASQASDGSVEK
jgi:hypothetical protein